MFVVRAKLSCICRYPIPETDMHLMASEMFNAPVTGKSLRREVFRDLVAMLKSSYWCWFEECESYSGRNVSDSCYIQRRDSQTKGPSTGRDGISPRPVVLCLNWSCLVGPFLQSLVTKYHYGNALPTSTRCISARKYCRWHRVLHFSQRILSCVVSGTIQE